MHFFVRREDFGEWNLLFLTAGQYIPRFFTMFTEFPEDYSRTNLKRMLMLYESEITQFVVSCLQASQGSSIIYDTTIYN